MQGKKERKKKVTKYISTGQEIQGKRKKKKIGHVSLQWIFLF